MPRYLHAILLAFLLILTASTASAYTRQGLSMTATDAAGNIVWKENYRPFGERLSNQAESADNRLGFHGKAVDTDTGLQYFGARYYDPVLGRFMGVDPVGFQEDNIHSFNKYAYGNNNPYRFVDPDGRQSMDIHFNVWNRAFSNSAGPNPNGAKGFEVAKQGMVQGIIDGAILSAEVGMTVSSLGLGAGAAAAVNVASKADFIVSSSGAIAHNSVNGIRSSLEGAGFKGISVTNKAGTETGTLHNIPGMKMDVRVMDGGSHHPARVVTNRAGNPKQLVDSATGRNFGNNSPLSQQRQQSHINLE
jgi:RHS repeat-associated protein